MKRLISFPTLCLAMLVLSAAVSGCGDKTSVKTVPVRGKVTVGNEPVAEGNVSLIPTSKDAKSGMSAGQIKNGEYVIYTGGKEGAPEGQYKVTVTPSMMPSSGGGAPKTPFNSKYSDVNKTTLTLTVPSANYDLKLDK
jgi:hypothetical protein